MKSKFSGLLVHAQNERFDTVKVVLEELSVAPARARNCKEAGSYLSQVPPPHVVVTEPVFPDGNWWDVMDLAAKATEKISVIVVSPVADIGLYMDVMSHGAYDFITDSFTVPELVHILRCALDDAAGSRRAQKQVSLAVRKEPSGQLPLS